MKEVKKINFAGFPGPLDISTSYTCKTLKDIYEFEISDKPDYLLCGCYSHEPIKYDCIKIFFTAECVSPDFDLWDYALGFDRLQFGDRYMRMPLYVLYTTEYEICKTRHLDPEKIISQERKFCSFTVSNPNSTTYRNEFFHLLSKYKKVDSGGFVLNNVGGKVESKFNFDSKHKFSIVFENCNHPGYITEKIVQAFGAGCIPIYFGADDVCCDFNTNAFINCHDYNNFDEVVEAVKRVDNDDDLYYSMLKEPVFACEQKYHEDCHKFLLHIFEQDLNDAKRIPNNAWIERKNNEVRILNKFNKIINAKEFLENSFNGKFFKKKNE